MSSGTYCPPPFLTVSIPKKLGGARKLGIPTVSDRVAQMVAKIYFEPMIEPIFHENSFGYVTRQRCWKFDWMLKFDVRGMFDNIDLLNEGGSKAHQL